MPAKRTRGLRPAPPDDDEAIGQTLCNRVRDLRKKRGWTLDEMSAACGVSRSMLSEVERGRANPTLAVAYRIGQAFGMSLGELVQSPSVSHPIDVIRADDRNYQFRNDCQCSIRTLSPLNLEKSVEFYELTLHPDGALRSSPHFEGARELLTVQRGCVAVTSAGDTVELRTGDSAHYRADVPHAIENRSDEPSVLFLVVTYLRD